LLTNRGISHCREIHDDTTRRGYFRCRAQADQTVTYEYVEYTGP
jgi:hypothetical protein